MMLEIRCSSIESETPKLFKDFNFFTFFFYSVFAVTFPRNVLYTQLFSRQSSSIHACSQNLFLKTINFLQQGSQRPFKFNQVLQYCQTQ